MTLDFRSLVSVGTYIRLTYLGQSLKSGRRPNLRMNFSALETVGGYVEMKNIRTAYPAQFEISMANLQQVSGGTGGNAIYVYDVDASVLDLGGLERTSHSSDGSIKISTNDHLRELRLGGLREVAGSLVVESNVTESGARRPLRAWT